MTKMLELNKIYCGDCLEYMREMPDKCVDLVLTDPPYGCGKAEWDESFPISWYREAQRISKTQAIITGSFGLKDTVPLVGDNFIDCVSLWNKNGMTRSPLGYGNWLAVVISGEKPKLGQNHLNFSVGGEMPEHPSPKPIEAMLKLIKRLTDEGMTILDPFMGSGTTCVACKKLGRNYIGIEKEPAYVEIALKRLEKVNNHKITDFFGVQE